ALAQGMFGVLDQALTGPPGQLGQQPLFQLRSCLRQGTGLDGRVVADDVAPPPARAVEGASIHRVQRLHASHHLPARQYLTVAKTCSLSWLVLKIYVRGYRIRSAGLGAKRQAE